MLVPAPSVVALAIATANPLYREVFLTICTRMIRTCANVRLKHPEGLGLDHARVEALAIGEEAVAAFIGIVLPSVGVLYIGEVFSNLDFHVA